MQISDTHRFLLRQMLQYEIDNNIIPKMKKGEPLNEFILPIKNYLEDRVKELS